jgi:hypothetical protein
MIAVATVTSIESRVADREDRGFWLQTGRAVKAFQLRRGVLGGARWRGVDGA